MIEKLFFKDMVNRRISMDSIMKVAREQQHRQFILLTPQDMRLAILFILFVYYLAIEEPQEHTQNSISFYSSNVGQTKGVKIFRLQDPERGQTTLPFLPVGSQ